MAASLFTLSRQQCRKADILAMEKYGIDGTFLMEVAGLLATNLLESQMIRGNVVICCGKGNNAGDGFVMARHLQKRGYKTEIWLDQQPQKLPEAAGINFDILRRTMPERIHFCMEEAGTFEKTLESADWIVDAIFGVGTEGAPREPYATMIRQINRAGKKVFAVDIPSGLDADTGIPFNPTVQACCTATFMAMKKGFLNPEASKSLGQIHLIDIGIPTRVFHEVGRMT